MHADVKEVAFEMWLEDISLYKPEAQAQSPGRRLFI